MKLFHSCIEVSGNPHQGHISRTIFLPKLKLDIISILSLSMSDHYKILNMAQELCSSGTCDFQLWYSNQELVNTKKITIKFEFYWKRCIRNNPSLHLLDLVELFNEVLVSVRNTRNINMYLDFISVLCSEMSQVIEILPSQEQQPSLVKQGSLGQYGAHLGHVGPCWAPYWPHEPCHQGVCLTL